MLLSYMYNPHNAEQYHLITISDPFAHEVSCSNADIAVWYVTYIEFWIPDTWVSTFWLLASSLKSILKVKSWTTVCTEDCTKEDKQRMVFEQFKCALIHKKLMCMITVVLQRQAINPMAQRQGSTKLGKMYW